MTDQTSAKTRRISPRRRVVERPGTRAQLLEAAGQVFAEKGFDRATGREICDRAGTNSAAINYYFGGMEGLHAAVIEEAQGRLISLEKLKSAIAGKTDAKAKLEAILGLAVEFLTGPISSSWVLRVLGREFVAPSSVIDELIEKQGIPKLRILKAIVAELMELPEDHPAVGRGCLTLIAPCSMLLIADRRTLRRVFPSLYLNRDNAAALARHMLDYALAGLAAAGRRARAES
jgi:TetR/AcrR family transcriptional regulator, regulator of cefoperazone and chloramphenicol sensitivity